MSVELPEEIPESLRRRGLSVEDDDDASLAWSAGDALEVIRSLANTKLVVLGGEVYLSQPWGLAPVYEGWSCEPTPGELAVDFADRSREVARSWIETYAEDHTSDAFFLLEFSGQDEAA